MSASSWLLGSCAGPTKLTNHRAASGLGVLQHLSPNRQQHQHACRSGGCWLGGAFVPRGAHAGQRAVEVCALAEAERPLDGEAWRDASFPDAFDRNFARGDLLGQACICLVCHCWTRAIERASCKPVVQVVLLA